MLNFFEHISSNKLLDFCEKRREGAEKIAQKAQEKGGHAELTAWHFNAKLSVYDDIIKKIKNKQSLQELKSEFNEKLNKISLNSQKEFQELIGQLEVLGEIILRTAQ